jgi:hypothetical protein
MSLDGAGRDLIPPTTENPIPLLVHGTPASAERVVNARRGKQRCALARDRAHRVSPHASCWKIVELEIIKLNIHLFAEVRDERKQISDKWWEARP